jgi:hypothetical protein
MRADLHIISAVKVLPHLDAIPKFYNSQLNFRILSLQTKFAIGDVDKTPATWSKQRISQPKPGTLVL